jgi:hypothetical protein
MDPTRPDSTLPIPDKMDVLLHEMFASRNPVTKTRLISDSCQTRDSLPPQENENVPPCVSYFQNTRPIPSSPHLQPTNACRKTVLPQAGVVKQRKKMHRRDKHV